MTNPELEPDPDFARQLEWQVRTALRREQRFALPIERRAARMLRHAALVLVSVVLGAGGVLAAERYQELRERELLIARAELLIDVQRGRIERFAERVRRQQVLIERGLAPRHDGEVRMREHELQHELRRQELDLEEIHAAGREPDRELDAPVIAGRDFVLERIALEAESLRVQRDIGEPELERRRVQVDAGLQSVEELQATQAWLAGLEARESELALRAELRRRHLAGQLSREEVRLHALRLAAVTKRAETKTALDAYAGQRERRDALVAAGLHMHDPDFVEKGATLEAELALAELEIELIDARLAE